MNNTRFTWTTEEIREFGHQVVELIADHLTTLPERPVFRPVPRERIDAFLHEPVPAVGLAAESVLAEFTERIEPYPFGNGHPRFFGWINSPPDVVGIFAEALAAAMNPSVAGGNHAAVYVERAVIGWFRAVLGFRAESMGLLVSGSSMANLTGLAVARYAAGQKVGVDVRARGLQTSGDGPRFVVYASREGHSSIRKAIELLGIGLDGYRALMEHDLALADRLAAQIEAAPDLELLARGLSAGLLPARATGARDSGRPIGRVEQARSRRNPDERSGICDRNQCSGPVRVTGMRRQSAQHGRRY